MKTWMKNNLMTTISITAIVVFIISWKVINKYLADELNKAIEKASKPKSTTAVQQAGPVK